MLEELIDKVAERYDELKTLSVNHHLLRYCIEEEEGFRLNPDIRVKAEFMIRFGNGGALSSEEQKSISSWAEYQEKISSLAFRNYLDALEQAIGEKVSLN